MTHSFRNFGEPVSDAAANALRVGVGAPPDTQVRAIDVNAATLFVHVDQTGLATCSASIPKPVAARLLRQIADAWDPPDA